MHRIDGFGATIDNMWTAGDPETDTPATEFTEAYQNAQQEELCGVIEAAGITLNKADNTQLLQALRLLMLPTASVQLFDRKTAPVGWIERNGGTIGDASSNATTRANADTWALFENYWNEDPDEVLAIYTSGAVLTTRGDSAAEDFAAHKQLKIPDGRGVAIIGWDNDRGVDPDRLLFSEQMDQMQVITGTVGAFNTEAYTSGSPAGAFTQSVGGSVSGYDNGGSDKTMNTISFSSANSAGARTGAYTRVRSNCALVCVKL